MVSSKESGRRENPPLMENWWSISDKSRLDLFRNITLTNVSGKMFFQVLANRLLSCMVQNIRPSHSERFLPGIAGCVKHTQALMETLLDAKQNAREIVVSWLDLANAYGSVAHNLVQLAMKWYNIPFITCKLIFNKYDELFVRVKTQEWTSTGLYRLAYSKDAHSRLCSYFLIVLYPAIKYFKDETRPWVPVEDHRLQTVSDSLCRRPDNNFRKCWCLQRTSQSGERTRAMETKPTKCSSLAMKKSDIVRINERTSTAYTSYDPQLEISGNEIPFNPSIFYEVSWSRVDIQGP